jgi:hypothetical protein
LKGSVNHEDSSPSESKEWKKPTTRHSSVALCHGKQDSVAKGSGKQALVAKGSLSHCSNDSCKQSNEENASSCSSMHSSKSSNCELSSDYVLDSEQSSCVASAGSCSLVAEEKSHGVYIWYARKIENALRSLDVKMKKLNFWSVEQSITLNSVYKKCKKANSMEKQCLHPRDGREWCSWEYMFNSWLAYGAKYPSRKNKVDMKKNPKLDSWVHEQQKKFVKSILQEDCCALLVNNGFIFQPRQHEQQSMATLVQRHKG